MAPERDSLDADAWGVTPSADALNWLAGVGEMRRRIREFDWSKHPLGSPETWPQSLKTIVRMMLDSRYAMWMGWGPELTFFYNDAYARDTLGKKHPWALGRSAREVWAEIWPDIGPRIERVLSTGEATWDEGLLLFLERSGYAEETYHTFSYSPLYNDAGKMGGMLCVVTEETKRVISERRLALLRELAANTTLARTIDDACDCFVQTMDQNSADVPFALIYLSDPSQRKLIFKRAVRVLSDHPAAFSEVPLGDPLENVWPMTEALGAKKPVAITNLEEKFGRFSGGRWPEPPQCAVALPIPGADTDHPIGALVLGVNPRRALDDDYEGFFQLVAGQLATALSNAQSYERERQRAEALAELDRAKTAFFSNVSHEFRTPLTLMLGPLEEMLTRNDVIPAGAHEQLEVVHRNGLRLLKLVNALLDFSRIEAGRVQANFEPVDLAAFTKDLASAFRSTIEKAGLQFDVESAALPEPTFVDRDMWEKIVFNLLSNAFKFTLDGKVSVRLSEESGEAVLRVADTGTGIPPEELPNVFKRFHRVQNARARTHEGTGIGLALVDELVKIHGGSIAVESKMGAGTVFTVRIPFGNSHLPADRIGSARQPVSTGLRGEIFVQESQHWISNQQPGIPDESRNVGVQSLLPRVLVADDNADMRQYISHLLRERYDVVIVGDGVEALNSARQRKPDMVLSDIMMPRMDGVGLLNEIRRDDALKTVPVILLSARAGGEARVEGIQHGADDYLVKPFSGRELLARIETHLKLARIRAEVAENEKRLRDEAQFVKQRLDSVLSSIEEQFMVLDADWRYVYVNDRVLEATRQSREELLNKCVWDLFPNIRTDSFYENAVRAATEKCPVQFEYLYAPWQRWFDIRIYPTPEGVAILSGDITDRKRMEDALRKAQEELMRMNRDLEHRVEERTASLREAIAQMEEFSYSVSHDLRAPARAMQGFALALKEDYGERLDGEGRQYLERILQSSSRMDRLIRDILTYSRVSRRDVQLQPVSLDKLVRDVIEQYPEFGPDRAKIRVEGQLPDVLGHEPSLSQIFSNLLGNAVKFVPAGKIPEVLIRGQRDGDRVCVRVEDNGIGIKPEYQHRLFGMFERVHSGDRYEGTGIGLAIVRKATERMGGKVGVESDGINGSRFWVQLSAA